MEDQEQLSTDDVPMVEGKPASAVVEVAGQSYYVRNEDEIDFFAAMDAYDRGEVLQMLAVVLGDEQMTRLRESRPTVAQMRAMSQAIQKSLGNL